MMTERYTTTGNQWADSIRAAYEALGRGDATALIALLAEDVEWRGAPRGILRRRPVSFGVTPARHRLGVLIAKGGIGGPGSWQVYHVMQRGGLAAVGFSWRTPAGTVIEHAHVLRLGRQITEIQDHTRHSTAYKVVEQQADG